MGSAAMRRWSGNAPRGSGNAEFLQKALEFWAPRRGKWHLSVVSSRGESKMPSRWRAACRTRWKTPDSAFADVRALKPGSSCRCSQYHGRVRTTCDNPDLHVQRQCLLRAMLAVTDRGAPFAPRDVGLELCKPSRSRIELSHAHGLQDAGPAGALLQRDSDSDEDEGELEPYDEDADRWDDEDDVSPEDERALAAFMVRAALRKPEHTRFHDTCSMLLNCFLLSRVVPAPEISHQCPLLLSTNSLAGQAMRTTLALAGEQKAVSVRTF